MKKAVDFIILAAMLLSLLTGLTPVSAADAKALENLYDTKTAACGTPVTNSATAAPKYNENYFTSGSITVVPGDKIYFGPCLPNQGYYLTTFTASGALKENQVKHDNSGVSVHAKFDNNAEILCWTVPEGTGSFRMATSQLFFDSTLITKNQPYDKDDYFAYWTARSVNVDYLRETASSGPLNNLFPKSDKTFAGRVDATGAEIAADAYRTSDFIPVKEGDCLYFGAAVASQGYHLVLFDANKKGKVTVNSNYMIQYTDLGRGYVTYMYRMRPGTAYVKVVAATGVYDDGIQLATLNQPYTGDQYRDFFNIKIDGTPQNPSSPLNGHTALFCGDSISYGAGDTLSYVRGDGRAWAGRISTMTGLVSTNASVSGAKASYIAGDDTAKWLYNQLEANKDGSFDMVVMHGGVNDARHNRAIGEISDSDDDSTYDLSTYVGGLQKLFVNAKKYFPDAKLFFISNFHLDGHATGQAKNMGPYFDKAKALCNKYGIIFIDLYGNAELNAKLVTTTTKYLPDTLHPNAEGYEIITPYILEALEAEFKPEEVTTPEETTTDEPQDETTPTADNETTASDAETTDAPAKKGCGGISLAIVSLTSILSAAVTLIIKKK